MSSPSMAISATLPSAEKACMEAGIFAPLAAPPAGALAPEAADPPAAGAAASPPSPPQPSNTKLATRTEIPLATEDVFIIFPSPGYRRQKMVGGGRPCLPLADSHRAFTQRWSGACYLTTDGLLTPMTHITA